MDCYNYNCPFRDNSSSSKNICDCLACPNRYDSVGYILSNKTLAKEDDEYTASNRTTTKENDEYTASNKTLAKEDDEYWKGFTAGREYERFIQKQEKESQSEEDNSIPGKWISVKFYGKDYVRCSNCGVMFKREIVFPEDRGGITYTCVCPNCSKQMTY